MKKNNSHECGFTLVELIITLSVAALLLTIGIPSFQNMVKDKRMTSTLDQLLTDLELAKSEAMTRNQSVTICRHNGEIASPTSCNNSADWKDGWVIFADSNSDTKVDADELIRARGALGADTDLGYSSPTIVFNARGFVNSTAGTLELCDNRGYSHGKKLIVSASGFVEVASATSASDCP